METKNKTKKELIEVINRLESQIEDYRNERKQMFNKYDFIRTLEEDVKAEIESGNITDEDEIRDYIESDIENKCIYYKTCFEIVMELNVTSFEIEMNGESAKDISELAYYSLYEFAFEELDMSELNELIEAKQNEEA